MFRTPVGMSVARQCLAGALIVLATIVPARAIADMGTSRAAARCAALWLGYDDVAQVSAFLASNHHDRRRAAAFRAVAHRLNPENSAKTDAYVARERRAMSRMIAAMILEGDPQSRGLFERLSLDCEALAARHPETMAMDRGG